jgi:phage host-nuclease inhibitor protein Gam
VINLSVTQGDNNGALDQHWDPDPTAKSYELQTSTDPMTDSSFTHRDTVTKSSCTTTGLTSGTRIWSRVRAVNPAGKGPWSEPVSKIVP